MPAVVIAEILGAGREMLDHPIELLPHAREAVAGLAAGSPGGADHQGRSSASGTQAGAIGPGRPVRRGRDRVGQDRTRPIATVFARHGTGADQALMVGNSLKSDVVPALEAGGFGVYVPHGLTWALEAADEPHGHPRYASLPDLGQLPGLVAGSRLAQQIAADRRQPLYLPARARGAALSPQHEENPESHWNLGCFPDRTPCASVSLGRNEVPQRDPTTGKRNSDVASLLGRILRTFFYALRRLGLFTLSHPAAGGALCGDRDGRALRRGSVLKRTPTPGCTRHP